MQIKPNTDIYVIALSNRIFLLGIHHMSFSITTIQKIQNAKNEEIYFAFHTIGFYSCCK